MKVLVIGGTSQVAQPVITELSEKGHQIKLFSRHINQSSLAQHFEVSRGDVFNNDDLKAAISGCDAIHISISKVDEALAVENILKEAAKNEIKLISYVSGCTVCEENRWFNFIDSKFRAEQLIIKSGITCKIFKPGWFFESLEPMIRNNKATVIGKKLPGFHWLSGYDFGKLVAQEYENPEDSSVQYALGPKKYNMKELLTEYCQKFHPEIKKVSTISTGLLRLIGKLFNKTEIVFVAGIFRYFELTKEPQVEVNREVLKSDFNDWAMRKLKN